MATLQPNEEANAEGWVATLPIFKGEAVEVTRFSEGQDVVLYKARWVSTEAVVKHFLAGAPSNERSPEQKARAETAGLEAFYPAGIAPELLWQGKPPTEIEGSVVVYRWVEGQSIAENSISKPEIEAIAATLRSVHNSNLPLKIISPNPRDLDGWWLRVHSIYRDLQIEMADALPPPLSEALSRLLQPVAADAQAHKRFWQGAVLTPVHGRPEPVNFIQSQSGTVIKNWQSFGLGDPAYEIGSAGCMLAEIAGEEAGVAMRVAYTMDSDEPMPPRRIDIYRRVWPYGFVLSAIDGMLKDERASKTPSERQIKKVAFHLRSVLQTYTWREASENDIVQEFEQWARQYLVATN